MNDVAYSDKYVLERICVVAAEHYLGGYSAGSGQGGGLHGPPPPAGAHPPRAGADSASLRVRKVS